MKQWHLGLETEDSVFVLRSVECSVIARGRRIFTREAVEKASTEMALLEKMEKCPGGGILT